MDEVSVCIVTFNSQHTIAKCLDSVLAQVPRAQIIVLDNHSNDQTIDVVKKYLAKGVDLIESKENLGFAKGNNLAVKKSQAGFLCFLNPDAFFKTKNDLAVMMDSLKANPKFGLIGPQIVLTDGQIQKTVRNIPNIFNAFKEYILKIKGTYDFYLPSNSTPTEVESVVGACMVMPRELFMKVLGFDEKYFLYYEDIALCQKLVIAGFKVVYLPQVKIAHVMGESGKSVATTALLQQSAQQFHGRLGYFLISSILKIGSII